MIRLLVMADIEDLVKGWKEDSVMDRAPRLSAEDKEKTLCYMKDLVQCEFSSNHEMSVVMREISRKYKICPKKNVLRFFYFELLRKGEIDAHPYFEFLSVTKAGRSQSGILNISVLTSAYPYKNADGTPDKSKPYSCPMKCSYCPDEPHQPKSYLMKEPAVARANRQGFDAIKQFRDRANCHARNGHKVDKIEIIVLGGTWSFYPKDYRDQFILDLFYAANTYWDDQDKLRPKRSLLEEQEINETTSARIIGLTLETRPDFITLEEISRLREYGCTRVQLGIQHLDDKILDGVNRQCKTEQVVRAIRLLKMNGFKVDGHLMFDLPGSTPEKDMAMFKEVMESDRFQLDQLKLYPTATTDFTDIKKWHEAGTYVPFSKEDLFKVIYECMLMIHPWIRVNRVIRDIPESYIHAGNKVTNLRQVINDQLKKENKMCKDIRSREPMGDYIPPDQIELKERTYRSSGGTEHFLSFETSDEKTILGFVRLRINDEVVDEDGEIDENPDIEFEELQGNVALVRELHVYGQMVPVGLKQNEVTQHSGYGTNLMKRAEEIARENGMEEMAVISGIGARCFYRKLEYELREGEGYYMMKAL